MKVHYSPWHPLTHKLIAWLRTRDAQKHSRSRKKYERKKTGSLTSKGAEITRVMRQGAQKPVHGLRQTTHIGNAHLGVGEIVQEVERWLCFDVTLLARTSHSRNSNSSLKAI